MNCMSNIKVLTSWHFLHMCHECRHNREREETSLAKKKSFSRAIAREMLPRKQFSVFLLLFLILGSSDSRKVFFSSQSGGGEPPGARTGPRGPRAPRGPRGPPGEKGVPGAASHRRGEDGRHLEVKLEDIVGCVRRFLTFISLAKFNFSP